MLNKYCGFCDSFPNSSLEIHYESCENVKDVSVVYDPTSSNFVGVVYGEVFQDGKFSCIMTRYSLEQT